MYIDEYGVEFSDDKKTLISFSITFEGVYRIPDGVEKIRDFAFANTLITSVTIPDTVHSIGEGAFFECPNIESIVIPSSVTVISESTFMSCENLREVILPEGLTRIERLAFWYCKSLESLHLPQSLLYIGSGAFRGCNNLEPVVLPDNIEVYENAFNSFEKVIMPKDQSRVNIIHSKEFDPDYEKEIMQQCITKDGLVDMKKYFYLLYANENQYDGTKMDDLDEVVPPDLYVGDILSHF